MKRHAFGLEQLEGRTLFSSFIMPLNGAPMMVVPALLATVKHQHPLQAAFNVAGTYTHDVHPGGNPDVGNPYFFLGTGNTPKLGNFDLNGWLQTPGFIQNGQSYGKLWLTNPQGSLSLIVTGPPQSPGVLPPSISFIIKAGHGAYTNSRGNGQIIIAASETTQKFVFKFNQAS
jgi:hypothetical protein